MNTSLFTYGTLAFPDIMQAVTGKHFPPIPGIVEEHAAYLLKGRVYPGLRPEAGRNTSGIIYSNIDEDSMRILDWFEDCCYRRSPIMVTLHDGSRRSAEVYFLSPSHYRLLTATRWDPKQFRAQSFAGYRSRCRRYHRQACDELGLSERNL